MAMAKDGAQGAPGRLGSRVVKVAAIQMSSGLSVERNMDMARNRLKRAKAAGAQWAALPEFWPLISPDGSAKAGIAEQDGSGPLQDAVSSWAKELGLTLFGGTIPLRSPDPKRPFNSLLVYGPKGERLARYDKLHLFRLRSKSGLAQLDERATIYPGAAAPSRLRVGDWDAALGICFDLRFAEFFRARAPFDVLVLPSAFAPSTGRAHWELLLRARAVENLAFVVAPGQTGESESGRAFWGHSMIVGPWGDVLADAGADGEFALAALDLDEIAARRFKLPALESARFRVDPDPLPFAQGD